MIQFIASYPDQPEIIILDCDDTNALTYGQQELALFNTYYGDSCYMPLHIYEGLSGKLITTLLKPAARVKILKTKVLIELPVEFCSRWAFEKCFKMFEILRV